MAKRKKAQPWDAVFDRVRAERLPNEVYSPHPSDAELDEVESKIGSRLPHCYREFMKHFGAGCFAELVDLFPLVTIGKGFSREAIESHTTRLRKQFGQPEYENRELLSRLVYFASNVNGNAEYAWDSEAVVSSTAPREYRYYRLWRLEEREPELLGKSFGHVVTRLETDVRVWLEHAPDDCPPGIAFRPLLLRKKKAPPKRDVKLWLAFNNNTARDLVRSIRDRGQTDAFPILADALQEAGCTNADLLDSCRTGDPDIDGKWVLQVLLGSAK